MKSSRISYKQTDYIAMLKGGERVKKCRTGGRYSITYSL